MILSYHQKQKKYSIIQTLRKLLYGILGLILVLKKGIMIKEMIKINFVENNDTYHIN